MVVGVEIVQHNMVEVVVISVVWAAGLEVLEVIQAKLVVLMGEMMHPQLVAEVIVALQVVVVVVVDKMGVVQPEGMEQEQEVVVEAVVRVTLIPLEVVLARLQPVDVLV